MHRGQYLVRTTGVETDKTVSDLGCCLEFLRKSQHPVTEVFKVCRTPQNQTVKKVILLKFGGVCGQ